MPRSPRIRESDDREPGRTREARRAWLSTWKSWAVSELPAETPRPIRVQVRAAVERALAHFGPDDDQAEVLDVIAGVVEEVHSHVRATAVQAAHAETKREVVAGAEEVLSAILAHFPQPAVAAMLRRPGYSRPLLAERLRRFLDRRLTGGESRERIIELVVGWINRRLAEQPPVASSTRVLTEVRKAAPLVTAAGLLAFQQTAFRETVAKQVITARDKARAWLDKLTLPQEPPKS